MRAPGTPRKGIRPILATPEMHPRGFVQWSGVLKTHSELSRWRKEEEGLSSGGSGMGASLKPDVTESKKYLQDRMSESAQDGRRWAQGIVLEGGKDQRANGPA